MNPSGDLQVSWEAAVRGARRLLEPNAAAGARVAIIGSTDIPRTYYDAFVRAATELHLHPTVLPIPPLIAPGNEAPASVIDGTIGADTVVLTGSASFAHSRCALDILAAGPRLVTFPVPVGLDSALAYLAAQGRYDASKLAQIKADCRRVSDVLDAGSVVHLTSRVGTDLTVSIAGRTSHAWYGIADSDGHGITAWPPGETHVSTQENTADGTIVADGYISGIGVSEPPLTLTVRDGRVVDCSGGAASTLTDVIDRAGDAARVLCEVGVGVNRWQPITGTNADKNAAGTWHVAIGTNASACFGGRFFDGTNHSTIHLDLVSVEGSSLTVDGTTVVADGVLAMTGTVH